MKFVRFIDGNQIKYGIWEENGIREIKGDLFEDFSLGNEIHDFNRVKLLAPCTPSKIICVGLNYRDHALEMNEPLPDEPVIFLKPPTTVIGPDERVVYPAICHRLDYEGELGVVIKDKIKGVSPEEAKRHILGYTCANDITARDLQKKDGQWTRGKSFDTFLPLGPVIVSDIDPHNLAIATYLNGECKQTSSTRQLIFKVEELVSFASEVMTLLPGDVIITGTPHGVGPMMPGDVVEVVIEQIGTLKNYICAQNDGE